MYENAQFSPLLIKYARIINDTESADGQFDLNKHISHKNNHVFLNLNLYRGMINKETFHKVDEKTHRIMSAPYITIFLLFMLVSVSCGRDESSDKSGTFRLNEISVNGVKNQDAYTDVNPDVVVYLQFSENINVNTINDNIRFLDSENRDVAFDVEISDNGNSIMVKPISLLKSYAQYQLVIYSLLKSESGNRLETGKVFTITAAIDMTDKFPQMSDEELLTLIQKQTFKYFWDFGHPESGMARERTTSGNTVTTGGTGFGILAMVVAVERNFIARDQAVERILKIVNFLDRKCTSYKGAFSHWINGETGVTQPFSAKDDGADIVETAFLFQGLLVARQYFDRPDNAEMQVREIITRLWKGIEWTWFCKNNEKTLYWHWSPVYDWEVNMKISGWNEALIVYVLAASSTTYPVSNDVYDGGWTRGGAFVNGQNYFGYYLPLGSDYGGPLFFSHYSFLGINPRNLTDKYVGYWEQNRNHTLINRAHCISNPNKYGGYSPECWGLTASDGNSGYSAHSPTNDKGVIAPTAALSSMPYTPEESMAAMRFFYYKLGDKLWSEYGFYDAFNLSAGWFDNQYVAIDQGPIIVMIENYRSGLIWSLFMSIPEIQTGMAGLGFQSPYLPAAFKINAQ